LFDPDGVGWIYRGIAKHGFRLTQFAYTRGYYYMIPPGSMEFSCFNAGSTYPAMQLTTKPVIIKNRKNDNSGGGLFSKWRYEFVPNPLPPSGYSPFAGGELYGVFFFNCSILALASV
jgi:hypothetical protein